MIRNRSMLALLAFAGLLTTTSAAFAVEAEVINDANVRQTKSTSSAIVNHVEEGDIVTVTECQGSRCKVTIPGPNGWVPKNVLIAVGDDEDDEDDEIPFNLSVGPGGITFGIGDGPGVTIPLTPQVCFFKGNNFTGASFCEAPGASNNHLAGGFNDQISSVQISGATSFTVCQNWFFGGACTNYNTSKPVLNGTYNDNVSSYKVF